jgi:hypothetical protein
MNIRLIEDPYLKFINNMKRVIIVFLFFLFNISFSQERSEIIKSLSNRDFKINLNAQKNIIFFEFCDPKKLSECDLKILFFDLRGIVRLLDEDLPIGTTNVLGNGKIIKSQTGNLSIASFEGIVSEKLNYNEFLSKLRSIFFY